MWEWLGCQVGVSVGVVGGHVNSQNFKNLKNALG